MNVTLHIDGEAVTLEQVTRKAQALSFTLGKTTYNFRSRRQPDGSMLLEQEMAPGVWQRSVGAVWHAGKDARRVQVGGMEARIAEQVAEAAQAGAAGALSPTAPMPGLVRQLLVKKGEKVKQGQALVVMEAMKLQMTLTAGGDGTVDAVLVNEGEMVPEGTELVRIVAAGKKA